MSNNEFALVSRGAPDDDIVMVPDHKVEVILAPKGSLATQTDIALPDEPEFFFTPDEASPYSPAMQLLQAIQARHAVSSEAPPITPVERAILSSRFSSQAIEQQRRYRPPQQQQQSQQQVWLPMAHQPVGVRHRSEIEERRHQASLAAAF